MFVYRCLVHKHGSPIFNIFNFFRISQVRSTFSKKFLTFPQPEAHFIFSLTFPQPEALSIFHF